MVSKSVITVRYAETDQMGIAHHSNYPVWYEVARTDLIKKMGMSYSEMEKEGIMLPLIELYCRYMGAAHYEDELEIEAKIESLTPVKIKFGYRIYCGKRLINEGWTLHAWVDSALKPINLKKRHPDIYAYVENALE